MVTFVCNKLGRDKWSETFKTEGITPHYRILQGKKLQKALCAKLIEESNEVRDAHSTEALIEELADVLEVIDAFCKTSGLSFEEITQVKEKKRRERGGFERGFYVEKIEMDESNPKVKHFRASPDKYIEL